MAEKAQKKQAASLNTGILDNLIGYHLRRAQIGLFQHFSDHLDNNPSQFGVISLGQFGILQFIHANPGLSQTTLGNAMGIERSTVVGAIDKLQARKFVERQPSPTDRRTNALKLTAHGLKALAFFTEAVKAHEDETFEHLTGNEKSELMRLIKKMADDGVL